MESNLIDVIIAASVFMLLTAILVVVLIFNYRKKQYENQQKMEKLEYQYQQTLLQTQLEIQEQTLKNISQEIHDNIGQALSLAKLNLNTMPATNDEALQQKILNSKELVSKAITDLRDLSRSLDTDYVQEMGLQRAIEYELEIIKKTGTVDVNLVIDGSVFRLEKQKELILFRIVQETFNNILKHANAKTINVRINYAVDSFMLKINDDGKGLDLQPLQQEKNNSFGLGIRNMHNRARLIGADFSMNSAPGKGTEVKIILSIDRTNETKQ